MKSFFYIFIISILLISCGEKESKPIILPTEAKSEKLPFLGEPDYVETNINGKVTSDTILHQIHHFSFINQDGKTITNEDFKGKIYVAEFFFTSCPSICPVMDKNLHKVYDVYKDNDEVRILSHSIDPEFDSPKVLKEYAEKKNIDTRFWTLVTGNRDSIYQICEFDYMAFAKTDKKADGGYIHSGFLTLIDKNRHVRGAYDGTVESDVDKLISDIAILLKER